MHYWLRTILVVGFISILHLLYFSAQSLAQPIAAPRTTANDLSRISAIQWQFPGALTERLAVQKPTGIYLISVTQNVRGAAIRGYAGANSLISDWIKLLESGALPFRVDLLEMRSATINDRHVNEFTMQLQPSSWPIACAQNKPVTKICTALPPAYEPNADLEAIVGTIYELGAKADLQFELFKPGKMDFHTNLQVVPVEISVIGSYAGLRSYIQDINRLPGLVILNSLFIKTRVDGVLEMRTLVNIFRANAEE